MSVGAPLVAKLTTLVSIPFVAFTYCVRKVGFENINDCFESRVDEEVDLEITEPVEIINQQTDSFLTQISDNYRLIGLKLFIYDS